MTLETATTTRPPWRATAVEALRLVSTTAGRVHTWAATTEGRRRTGHALRSLDPAQWHVTQLLRLPDGGRADHLVVGPPGAFILDSRVWRGVVTVDSKGATITPDGRPDRAWTARGQHCSLAPAAAALGRATWRAGGRAVAPRAVVVVWARFPERLALSGGITFVAGDDLAGWLSGQARVAAAGPAPPPLPSTTPTSFRPTRLG